MGHLQEIRERSREATRLLLRLSLSRPRVYGCGFTRDRNLEENPRGSAERVQLLLPGRHETLRERPGLEPSLLLHIPPYSPVRAGPMAKGDCCQRIRPDGRGQDVKVAREYHPAAPGSRKIRCRPVTNRHTSNSRTQSGY